MAIDRKKFFEGIRSGPFPGSLSAEAVRGVTAILDAWERSGLTDLRWLAYMLATVLAECGRNMLPVREGFKTSDAAARSYVRAQGYRYAVEVNGQVYYGRGLVQLTWEANYRAMGAILGIDLVNNPDLALDPAIASKIMFEGMTRGTFTKKKLADYFNAAGSDWRNARRIINALDRADEIANYAKQFYADLTAAEVVGTAPKSGEPTAPPPKTTKDIVKEAARDGALAGGGGGATYTPAIDTSWGFAEWMLLVLGVAVLAAVAFGVSFAYRMWRARRAAQTGIHDAAGAEVERNANEAQDSAATDGAALHAKAAAAASAALDDSAPRDARGKAPKKPRARAGTKAGKRTGKARAKKAA